MADINWQSADIPPILAVARRLFSEPSSFPPQVFYCFRERAEKSQSQDVAEANSWSHMEKTMEQTRGCQGVEVQSEVLVETKVAKRGLSNHWPTRYLSTASSSKDVSRMKSGVQFKRSEIYHRITPSYSPHLAWGPGTPRRWMQRTICWPWTWIGYHIKSQSLWGPHQNIPKEG